VLNNLRETLRPTLEKIGKGFAATGLSANFWTFVGLGFALLSAVVYGMGIEFGLIIGGVLLLVSGFFDMVDGQVAKVTGKTSKKGEYLDLNQIELLKPVEIKNFLYQYVIGQEEAKKYLSVAVYNHYKRLLQVSKKDEDDIEIEKSNIILVGETETGKTLLSKNNSKNASCSFYYCRCNNTH